MRLILFFVFAVLPLAATAQDRRPSHCIALAESTPGMEYLHKASWSEPVVKDTVRINYIDHSTFLIQSHGGLNMATDFTGFLGAAPIIPDVVTMNHAHSSHWTQFPDPAIPHVLRGWPDEGEEVADHHLDLGEVLVRNVATDIRSRFGVDVEENGNSIFIFEVAGLCIGHLGHLHHEPNNEQYAAIGRLDVVMAAVDGGLTVDLPTMQKLLKRLRASVVIPMHWFGRSTLNAFISGMGDAYRVERTGISSMEISLRDLPSEPTIIVLEPQFLRMPEE